MADRTSAHNAPIHDLASKTMLELANPLFARVAQPGPQTHFDELPAVS